MVFSMHQSESAMGIHVPPPSCSPLPSPPPTSLPTPSLWAVTEHQLQVPGALTCFIAAAAAAKSFQLCPTLRDPIDGSPPGSPVPGPWSLGFSRQEHWSGLPFPSPMPESEKWKWSRSVVSDFQRPHGLQPTRLLLPWDFPGKSTGVGCHCLLRFYSYFTIIYWLPNT